MGKRSYEPDFKKPKRVKDPKVMQSRHLKGVRCVLCGKPGSLDHVYPKGQGGDDVDSNLLDLCGSGTTGHHGLKTNEDPATMREIGAYLVEHRPDFMFYIQAKLGETEGREWLRQKFFVDV